MQRELEFYKKNDGRWYADVPEYIAIGGTEDDCEMVAGADTWLDFLDQEGYGSGRLRLLISDVLIQSDGVLQMICSDEHGAVYYLGSDNSRLMWLCNVSKFVFGQHPETIYYKITE